MRAFSPHFCCIGLDTPGYGLSDDFVQDGEELRGYVDALAETLDALGLKRVCIYGAATGAQIGIEFSKKFPVRVALLMLDSNGDFDDVREEILDGYFPDLTPRRDGGHLLTIWDICRHLSVFFPWQSTRNKDRFATDVMAPELIQQAVDDYLRAGLNYKKAYLPAFYVENWQHAHQLTVPTTINRWPGSLILEHTDALIAKGLPGNFKVLECDPPNRFDVQVKAARNFYRADAAPPAPGEIAPANSGLQHCYFPVRSGQLHARVCLNGSGPPLVVLHQAGGSSRLMQPLLESWVGIRPVIGIDLPGHGESDELLDTPSPSIQDYATVTFQAIDTLGFDRFDVAGYREGAAVALEMATLQPAAINRIMLISAPFFEGRQRADLMANLAPSLAPRWDGAHLVTAWAKTRDEALYWPWYRRERHGILWQEPDIAPQRLHLRVTELLKSRDRYRSLTHATLDYPMRERLVRLERPCLACAPNDDPLNCKSDEAAAAAPAIFFADLPEAMSDWAAVLERFGDDPDDSGIIKSGEQCMKAYELSQFGVDNLKLVARDAPEPGPGEVLVRMHAASINYRDFMIAQGMYNPNLKLPFIPLSDGAGEVEAIGEGVTRLKVGDRVTSLFWPYWDGGPSTWEARSASRGCDLPGVLSELAVFGEGAVCKFPDSLSFDQAATLPCAALTAWTAMTTKAGTTADSTVLIQGTGGVSIFALQFSKALGATTVVISSSDAKLERAKALGADHTINYAESPDWGNKVLEVTEQHGADTIVEIGGAGTMQQSLTAVALNGHIALIGALTGLTHELNLMAILGKNVNIHGGTVGNREDYEKMLALIEQHAIEPVIDKIYPFDDAASALADIANGEHFGKLNIGIG